MWIKRIGQLGVLPVVDVPVGHRPFARAEHGVKSPVEENAEFGVLKRCLLYTSGRAALRMRKRHPCRYG